MAYISAESDPDMGAGMSGEGLRKVAYLLLLALIVYVAGPGGA